MPPDRNIFPSAVKARARTPRECQWRSVRTGGFPETSSKFRQMVTQPFFSPERNNLMVLVMNVNEW
jgi:hypothetical protein